MSHHASTPLDDLPPFLKPAGLLLGLIGMAQNWNVNDILAAMSAIASFAIGFVTVANFAINSVVRVAAWRKARKAKP